MTQEDKQLLLKDLCGRLPYGVKFHYNKHPQSNIDQDCDGTAIGYYCNLIVSANDKDFCVDRCKLYLRPMSSMTDRELIEFLEIRGMNINSEELRTFREGKTAIVSILPSYSRHIDWLNAHHFDFRNLIECGLAIEVTEENNPYNE